jgi:hypothetical protein
VTGSSYLQEETKKSEKSFEKEIFTNINNTPLIVFSS